MKTRQSAKKLPIYSLVIPVYKNESSIKDLCKSLATIKLKYRKALEIIFVVDGSPDKSLDKIIRYRKECKAIVKILELSKNQGSHIAVKAGIDAASGKYIVTKAADLQEPIELTESMFSSLESGRADIVFGQRQSRKDPFLSTIFSQIYWWLYKHIVDKQIPNGGVDVAGINEKVKPYIEDMKETRSSIVEFLFWLGFTKEYIPYNRLKRNAGKSAWSFSKKIGYVIDSTFSFSNFPIVVLFAIGTSSFIFATIIGCAVLIAKATGYIQVPGYAATLTISLFFFGLNAVGLSIIGNYTWRTYENTKQRPHYIIKNIYE